VCVVGVGGDVAGCGAAPVQHAYIQTRA
jgi:hypothetical protein